MNTYVCENQCCEILHFVLCAKQQNVLLLQRHKVGVEIRWEAGQGEPLPTLL